MKVLNPFNPEFWGVEYEYEPPVPKVVPIRRDVVIVNARADAEALEADRAEYAKSREQRLCNLLRQCMTYVKDSRQGRGDPALERLIMEELAR